MIYGVGLDLLAQARIDRMYARHGARLVRKLLCAAERREFAKSKKPARYLAMNFAAKEAFVKALGTGFRGVDHRDVGVVRDGSGKPALAYSRALKAELKTRGIARGHVSLSDDAGLVCAMVVLERD